MKLIHHPASPRSVTSIKVHAEISRGESLLLYRVEGGLISMPFRTDPVRTDGLWQTTCYELFVKPVGGQAYFEFNFSPSTAWAAYRFDGYRTGMTELPLRPPRIELGTAGVSVIVDLGDLPGGDWLVGINALIESPFDTKSYWALAHPAGKPDFHDPACFALRVPAPRGA